MTFQRRKPADGVNAPYPGFIEPAFATAFHISAMMFRRLRSQDPLAESRLALTDIIQHPLQIVLIF
jgi:hypothetical protein